MAGAEGENDGPPPERRRRAATSRARRSSVIEAHNIYEKYHQDLMEGDVIEEGEDQDKGKQEENGGDVPPQEGTRLRVKPEVMQRFRMFHRVEKTGVIYATKRAISRGFSPNDPTWANMGQGAPETGPVEGAPPRSFKMESTSC